MRKMISFKIENLPEKQHKIMDDWANSQTNIQQSIANVIQHVVSMVGNEDVMDFDVQRKLHVLFGSGAKPIEKIVEVRHEQLNDRRDFNHRPTNPETKSDNQDIYKKADWFKEDE